MEQTPLTKAVSIVGGQSAMARAIGTSQANVWYWINKAKAVPAEFVAKIESATGGAVQRHDLRPDLFPTPVHPPAGDGEADRTPKPTAEAMHTAGDAA